MIEVYNVFTPHACNTIINEFNNDDRRRPGTTGCNKIDTQWKKSTDLGLDLHHDDCKMYNDIIEPGLNQALDLYTKKYPVLNEGAKWHVADLYNIQHYKDGEGYSADHIEYMPLPNTDFIYRMLAWMINLNDSPCGTEFLLQKQILQAREGNVSIWPAYWTHHHKGVCPTIGNKYIVTGWCVYEPFEPAPDGFDTIIK